MTEFPFFGELFLFILKPCTVAENVKSMTAEEKRLGDSEVL